MRKISIILSIAMIVAILMPTDSFGAFQYDKKLEEAIVKSKQLFNITEEYDVFDSSVSSYDGKTIFYLNWSDSNKKLGEINVSISSDGTIYNYNKFRIYHEESNARLPNITKEEGLDIVQELIKKISPEIVNSLKYKEIKGPLNLNSSEYSYRFIRVENDIPYIDNNLSISIDKNTGELISYYLNWDMDLTFPENKDIIEIGKAKQLYKEKIGLKLVYKTDYTKDSPSMYLVYTTFNDGESIDANTGNVICYNNYENQEKFIEEKNSLNPDETKAVKDISNLLSDTLAEEKARETLNIDSEYKLLNINLYSYLKNKGEYVWTMSFLKGEEDDKYFKYDVSLDAKNGELISFYFSSPKEEAAKMKYTKGQSLEIAKDYIKKMNPEKYDDIELFQDISNQNEEDDNYYFNFIRKFQDAYIASDSISVTVDGVSGQVIGYNRDWFKGDISPIQKDISLDEAYKILFEDIGMELKYVTVFDYSDSNKVEKNIKLCYSVKLDKPLIISAQTGDVLDYNGKPFKEKTIAIYKDIQNSYAKEKIETLAQYGIYLSGDEFKPKDKIKQKEFLYLLAKAKSPSTDFADYTDEKLYNYLMNLGIIKEGEKSPDSNVTKEESIKYVIRAMKYDKVADLNSIYKDLFKDMEDIDESLKGYVSIAYGLNIVKGVNGYLKPKAELNREDSANIIYNFLFNN